MTHGKRTSKIGRRRFLELAAAAGFVTGSPARWLFAEIARRAVSGRVLGGGKPLAGVRVSDGRSVVSTNAAGRFAIEVGPRSGKFVFVTTPRGFWTDRIHVPTAQVASRGEVDFHLEPRPQHDRFRFVFWTDMHLEGGGFRIERFRQSVQETSDLKPDFVWAQGDISLDGKAGADFLACAADLSVPIRSGAGNHEMLLAEPDPRGAFEGLFGPTYYSFDWSGIHCVVMDGIRIVRGADGSPAVHGGMSERELAWLEADLAAKPAGMPVVAAVHIPLVTTYCERRGTTPDGLPQAIITNAGEVRRLLGAHDVKLVLQGHLHENERVWLDGIEYVESQAACGSWWRSRGAFERGVDDAPRGFRVVDVDGEKISHRFLSSAESHTEAEGELRLPTGKVFPRRKKYFLVNMFDAPDDSAARARLDGEAWRPLETYPAVSRTFRWVMPHHYLLDADTTALAPGAHRIEVETSARGETFRLDESFEVEDVRKRVLPVVYVSDLYHPHQDPDDHFDLAAIFAMEDIDLRAVVLDDGVKQETRPGRVPLGQIMKITGKRPAIATGLAPNLRSPADTGREQPARYQEGVELILRVLRESDVPVSVVSIGSARDVAAAWNRDPALCAEKIERLYIFIGDAHGAPGFEFREWNVKLDLNAYLAVMRSGLPVYWVPCFDGGGWKPGCRASYWQATQGELLAGASAALEQFFIYALLKKKTPDPGAFLERPVDPAELQAIFAKKRNLWCAAVFTHLADRTIVRVGDTYRSIPLGTDTAGDVVEPFTFERVNVAIDPTGMALYPESLPYRRVERFRAGCASDYPRVMTALSAELLASL